jgi:prepilin-type processing-associated H-X9-DG protein
MSSRGRRAFTLTDLLILLLMLALLCPVVFQSGQRSRETANRVKCGSNLRMIGQAILLYANENKGNYPRTIYQAGTQPTQYTGVHAPNPFGTGAPGPDDVTAALFLLIRTQDIDSSPFVCPSTDCVAWDFGGKTAQQVSNFPGERNLSYSYANPYPDFTAVNRGYKMNLTVGAQFAVAADMNPGQGGGYDATLPKSPGAPQQEMSKANSRNHQGAGQNVLYGDGHVDFVQNPFVGVQRDNIYTPAGGADPNFTTTSPNVVGLPRWAGDSVLLPAATMTPNSAAAVATVRASRRMATVLIVAGVVLLLAIGVAVFVLVLRKPRPAVDASYASSPPPPPPQYPPVPPGRHGPPPLPPR